MMKNNEGQAEDLHEKVRISPRISRKTRALAKAIYPLMGVTLEDRVEQLLLKDLDREMKKAWFKKLWKDNTSPFDESASDGDWRREGV